MDSSTVRKFTGLFVVVLYLLVGIPLWYKLTSVFQARLPVRYIESLAGSPFQDVHMVIPVFIKSELYRFPDIDDAVQTQVNFLLDTVEQSIPWSLQVLMYDEELEKDAIARNVTYHVVKLVLDQNVGMHIPRDLDESVVFFSDQEVVSNDLPFYIAQTIVEYTFTMEFNYLMKNAESIIPKSDLVVPYSPDMHISMTLLNGDGNSIGWDIDNTLKTHFTPFREFMSPMVNFTVDTNIVCYNDLNLSQLKSSDNVTTEELAHAVDVSELTFLDSQYLEKTVLNLAIVFPSNESCSAGLNFVNNNVTFNIANDTNSSNWQSYMLAGWGLLVVNKYPLEPNTVLTEDYLTPIIAAFTDDVMRLIGLNRNPMGHTLITPITTSNSYKRLLTLSNLEKSVKSLSSLTKLTKNFKHMVIPEEVQKNVEDALNLRLDIIELLNNPNLGDSGIWNYALSMSNRLLELCEDAFSHGEMIQQNFEPQEHKIAVYLPLLGPISIIIFFGSIKSFKKTIKVGHSNEKDLKAVAEHDHGD